MNENDERDQEPEYDDYEETHVLLICRTCRAVWEYEAVEAVGCKVATLVTCPHCSAGAVLTV